MNAVGKDNLLAENVSKHKTFETGMTKKQELERRLELELQFISLRVNHAYKLFREIKEAKEGMCE